MMVESSSPSSKNHFMSPLWGRVPEVENRALYSRPCVLLRIQFVTTQDRQTGRQTLRVTFINNEMRRLTRRERGFV